MIWNRISMIAGLWPFEFCGAILRGVRICKPPTFEVSGELSKKLEIEKS